jgi:SEC-C motif
MYGSARTLLEFSAFIHEVYTRLNSAAGQPREKRRPAGEEFFAIIVRARSGTSSPAKEELLRSAGASAGPLKPFHVAECIKNLAKEPGHESVTTRYNHLCDFVHHNLSSQTLGNAGSAISGVARSSGGGAIALRKPGPITQFQYPLPSKAKLALHDTGTSAHFDAESSVKWINLIPWSPYSQQQVLEITGFRFGVQELQPSRRGQPISPLGETKVGRNEQRPCGSKKKYKKCCGAA